eukprot:11864672-Ditylum_brightwellii.AAC.1
MHSFIGMINYYHDIWLRCSKVLGPLVLLMSKATPWKWMQVKQKAFDRTKKVVSQETLLVYPDFNALFEMHMGNSNTQLGAVTSQQEMFIAFYSCKLNSTQRNYTAMEQELLAIAETLKEFKNILIGQRIKVYTNHKTLTYKTTIVKGLYDGAWSWKTIFWN